jgi:hypothetical protein
MKNTTTATPSGNGVLSSDTPMTVFELDKWVVSFSSGNTVGSAAVQAGLDPYYPGIYFPADQAKLICETFLLADIHLAESTSSR